MSRTKIFAMTVVALFSLPALGLEKKPQSDMDKLQGTWETVEFVADGDRAPPDINQRIKLIFTGDKLEIKGVPPRKHNYSFKLEPSKSPKLIYITPIDGELQNQTTTGLYEFDKDRFKLVFSNEPRAEPPAGFMSTKGSTLILFECKKAKQEKKK